MATGARTFSETANAVRLRAERMQFPDRARQREQEYRLRKASEIWPLMLGWQAAKEGRQNVPPAGGDSAMGREWSRGWHLWHRQRKTPLAVVKGRGGFAR